MGRLFYELGAEMGKKKNKEKKQSGREEGDEEMPIHAFNEETPTCFALYTVRVNQAVQTDCE